MLHFKIEQDPSSDGFYEAYKDEPWGKESVQLFQQIKHIIFLGGKHSLIHRLREEESKLIKYCKSHNFWFQLGDRPRVWDKVTGLYLFDIEIPVQEEEEFRAELAKWKRS